MAKTSKISNISAKRLPNEQLEIEVKVKGKNTDIKVISKIYSTGRVKFSLHHPDLNKEMSYEGIVEGNKLFLYPIAGTGVLSIDPIIIK